MTERVRFYFDPVCPWAYQTSRWARRLAELGEIRLDWGLFSLAVANAEDADGRHARSQRALRTAVAVRRAAGPDGVGAFYAALGRRVHEGGEALDDPAVTEAALVDASLDAALQDVATCDEATWQAVGREHRELVERTRSFGVPTIVLDGGAGPAIFGPVISRLPDDDDTVALWRHVSWLARHEDFAELKRERLGRPSF
ncbi:Rv2466c family mycothiol-dependent reductase [soil metagenome]